MYPFALIYNITIYNIIKRVLQMIRGHVYKSDGSCCMSGKISKFPFSEEFSRVFLTPP